LNATPRRPSGAARPNTVDELLDLTPDLPPLPAVAMATQREAARSGASGRSVAALICTDPALTARVLRLANSAYYGSARQVFSVQDAVTLLGMNGIQKLCLLAGSYPWLQGGLPAYGLAPGALLNHSLAAAVGTKAAAEGMGMNGEAAFTAGLLHDIGKVGLATWIPPEQAPVKTWLDERMATGFDHAQIGGELARRWNLPQELVEAIACHHMPGKGLEDAPYIGNLLARLILGQGAEPDDPSPLDRCSVTMEILTEIAKELVPEFSRLKAIGEACS